jgi:hypothetical protein
MIHQLLFIETDPANIIFVIGIVLFILAAVRQVSKS